MNKKNYAILSYIYSRNYKSFYRSLKATGSYADHSQYLIANLWDKVLSTHCLKKTFLLV